LVVVIRSSETAAAGVAIPDNDALAHHRVW
jgi:hypothetical protein